MISLQLIESDIKDALKSRNQIAADTLRGLKVRIQNEQITKLSHGASEADKVLSEEEIVSLVQSEVKRRREAAKSFSDGGRQESADKELLEAEILQKYLPAQLSDEAILAIIDEVIAQQDAHAADFGKVMGQVKARVGQSADGASVARLVKERLK